MSKKLSSKCLSQLLLDYSIGSIRGGFFQSKPIVPEDHPPEIAEMIREVASDPEATKAIAQCLNYFAFRDQIRAYQQENNVSGVAWETVCWKGNTFRFPNHKDQLELMPQDIKTLNRWRDKTVAKFLEFCDRYRLLIYRRSDDFCASPASPEEVRDTAARFDASWLGHGGDMEMPVVGDNDELVSFVKEYWLFLVNPLVEGDQDGFVARESRTPSETEIEEWRW